MDAQAKREVKLANHTVLVSRSGEEAAIDDTGAPIFAPDGKLTGHHPRFRDVTEQRKAQKATAQLAAIVEYSGDAIATKNLDGIILIEACLSWCRTWHIPLREFSKLPDASPHF